MQTRELVAVNFLAENDSSKKATFAAQFNDASLF